MCNYAAKVRLFFDIYNNYKLFCKNSLKSLCMCIFFCTFARYSCLGRHLGCLQDASLSLQDGGSASYRTALVMPTGRLFEAIGRRLCLLQDGIGYAYRTPR